MFKTFRRKVAWSVSIILGSILLFIGASFWLTKNIEEQTGHIVRQRALLQRFSQVASILAEFKRAAPIAAAYEVRVKTLLPSQENLLDFPRWIDGLARARNVSLQFNFQGDQVLPRDDSTAGFLHFNANIIGQTENITGFIQDIEQRSPRYLIAFEGFELARSGAEYQLNIQGRVFFR